MLTKALSGGPPSFLDQLNARATDIEAALTDYLPRRGGYQDRVIEAMSYAVLDGGKRLRPFLMLETASMFNHGGEGVLRAASALECIHVYSLIHDDLPCMDDDDLRRGKPTVHIAFDEAIAVLAGDALLTLAFDLLARPGLHPDPQVQLEVIADLGRASGVRGMIGGQVIDITQSEEGRDEALITELQSLKTGALITFAVTTGAKLAGVSGADLQRLEKFACDMGLAFQIKDDILDIEGDPIMVGKAVGKDENQGKATFVSILGLEGAKQKAEELRIRAKSRLEPFGEKADILCDALDFVLDRNL